MALAGCVYQSRENARKFSFSNGGNVAEKTVEVKGGKFLVAAGGKLQVGRFQKQQQPATRNPPPTACALQTGAPH